ncbi:MAG: Biopolymer transport protein ExbD/TolR [Fibrobacteres bacterium]|nr:Biopolymer transport protein ExbD/TolR [Fibrobacterota bacterium]
MAKRKIKRQPEAALIITSLVDVFVIVLVYLIRSISSEGSLMTSADNLVLPMSQRSKSPTEISLTIIGDQKHITVDDQVLMETEVVRKQDSLLVKPVLEILTKKREEERKAEVLGLIKEATGKVVVQFDKNTPYDIVTKIMATCGYAGYNNIKFAVSKKNEEG